MLGWFKKKIKKQDKEITPEIPGGETSISQPVEAKADVPIAVEAISQDDTRPHFFQRPGGRSLHRSLRPHGHKRRGGEHAVGCSKKTRAGPPVCMKKSELQSIQNT